MFVYCLWSGDIHENRRHLLGHKIKFHEAEFEDFCNKARADLIQSTSQNHEVMDTVDDVKSIWEYTIDDDLLKDIKKVLIERFDFFELKDFPSYHVHGVDPYDYEEGGKVE